MRDEVCLRLPQLRETGEADHLRARLFGLEQVAVPERHVSQRNLTVIRNRVVHRTRHAGFRRLVHQHWRTGVRETVGSLLRRVYLAEARSFVERLRSVSDETVGYIELPGVGHGFDLVDGVRTPPVVAAIGRFLQQVHRESLLGRVNSAV